MIYTTETVKPIGMQLAECEPIKYKTVEDIAKSKGEIRPEVLAKYEKNGLKTKPKSEISDTLNLNIENQTFGYFKKEKQYECWVDEVSDGVIYSRGRDIDELGPEIIFELDINDIDENDKELVKEAAVFMVKIGTMTAPKGQVTNKTIIKFRRFKVITDLELEKIAIKEKYLAEALGIEA